VVDCLAAAGPSGVGLGSAAMSAFEEGGHVSELLSNVGSAIESGRLRYSPSPTQPEPCTVFGCNTSSTH